jgi:hypothetical protein
MFARSGPINLLRLLIHRYTGEAHPSGQTYLFYYDIPNYKRRRLPKGAMVIFSKSDSKCDFSNVIFGQVRQRAVELYFLYFLCCFPTKEGGLAGSARRLA